ncbi:MAG: hypothetical protein F7C34_04340 [Desulfurococcales archaeon]|nr:hypothetical protein [Desulfurococcales archaeon]
MSMISPVSVAGRALLALGIALFLGGLVGSLIGVRYSVTLSGSETLPEGGALSISVYTLTSSGRVRVEVWNATTAYYIAGIRGDPRSLMKGLEAFNISTGNEDFRTDFRLGVVYGVAEVRASRGILAALPGLSRVLRFNIHQLEPVEPGHYVLEKKLGVNEALIFFAVGRNVTYSFSYSVAEKNALAPDTISLAGALTSLAGLAVLRLGVRSGSSSRRRGGSGP